MKAKKIEVITLHRIVNYGSVLQAYATQYALENMGYDVEFLDYYPERMHLLGMLKRIKNKNNKLKKSLILRTIARCIMFPSYILRFSRFNKFIKSKLKLSPITYYTANEIDNNPPIADYYCTGSDQVWNSGWNEKIDGPFFLNFDTKNKKCFSYAASFGKSNLEDWEKNETKKLLEKYSNISVREKSGVEILENLGIKNSINVLDPTLLLNKKEWSKLASDKYKGKNYIFVYNLNRNKKIDKYVERLAKEKHLKIYYVSYALHEFYKKGEMKCNVSVEDFLSLIKYATYVVTDSFHATAFSINFNTPFVIVYPGKYSTRLQSILKITGLENRVAQDENDLDVVKRKIDFEKVNKKINIERQKSLSWLKESLK